MAPSSAKIAWLLCCLVTHTMLPARQGLRMRYKNTTLGLKQHPSWGLQGIRY